MVLDNARMHHAKLIQHFLKKTNIVLNWNFYLYITLNRIILRVYEVGLDYILP